MIAINGIEIEPYCFNDGTFNIQYEPNFRDVTITWAYDNNEEMILLYMLVKHLRANFCISNLTLNMPYIPNARKDRVKNNSEIFTLKYFCEFINDLKFDSVFVCHPHSNVSMGLLNNVIEDTSIIDYINEIIKKENIDVICFPDEGARKNFCGDFHIPTIYGSKIRDWETGEIKEIHLNIDKNIDIKDKNILIIDDICAKGETLLKTAKLLKKQLAKNIYCYVTHCENTVVEEKILNGSCFLDSNIINKLYTTDSIFTSKLDKIIVAKCYRIINE